MKHINLILLLLCIGNAALLSIATPAYSGDDLKFESILSGLRVAVQSNDAQKTFNALLQLNNVKSEMPLPLLFDEIKDIQKDPSYRGMLADFTSYKIRYVGKSEFVGNVPRFESIIKNKSNPTSIRRHMISALTKGYVLNEIKKGDSASAYDVIPFLTRIATDKNEEPMVVSQAINSLSRIHYNGINDKLLQMVENWNREPPLKVKSASESLARAKDKRVIPVLMEIINLSDNLDTFVTAVYSLGLMGPVEMIAPVVNNYDRFGVLGKGACRGALRRNRELLKEIIAKKKPGPIMPSVIALGLIRDESALPYLASLLRDGAFDKKIISNTIHQIEVYTNEEKRAGNETNSSLRIY